MQFSIKGFFGKCDQISTKLRNWWHLLKKSLLENFIFCAVLAVNLLLLLLETLVSSSLDSSEHRVKW